MTLLAVFALIFAVGCGGDDKDDSCGAGCGDGCTSGCTDGCGGDKGDTPAKVDGDADKEVTFNCAKCSVKKTAAAGSPPS